MERIPKRLMGGDFHAEHHKFMWVNSYNLEKLHRALIARGYGDRMEIAPGYLSVLLEATRQPNPDPEDVS